MYEQFPASLKTELLIEPRRPEALETSKENMELKALTNAHARKARIDKMQRIEKRFWVNPQFNPLMAKAQKNRNAPKSDEDRNLMFDIILEDVYNRIQQNALEPEELPKKTTLQIEEACKAMYEQQRVLISAADDEQLVEKFVSFSSSLIKTTEC